MTEQRYQGNTTQQEAEESKTGWEGYIKMLNDRGVELASFFPVDSSLGGVESPDFHLSRSEVAMLCGAIDNQDAKVCENGLTLFGKDWVPLILKDDALIFRGKGDNKEQSLVVSKSCTMLMCGLADSKKANGLSTSALFGALDSIKDYLKSNSR